MIVHGLGSELRFEPFRPKREERMSENQEKKETGKYVYVKDNEGVTYICRLEDLKRPDEMTEEEKAGCMNPPGDA